MATDIEMIGRKIGLIMHDKILNELRPSMQSYIINTTFQKRFTMKIQESNLIFVNYQVEYWVNSRPDLINQVLDLHKQIVISNLVIVICQIAFVVCHIAIAICHSVITMHHLAVVSMELLNDISKLQNPFISIPVPYQSNASQRRSE